MRGQTARRAGRARDQRQDHGAEQRAAQRAASPFAARGGARAPQADRAEQQGEQPAEAAEQEEPEAREGREGADLDRERAERRARARRRRRDATRASRRGTGFPTRFPPVVRRAQHIMGAAGSRDKLAFRSGPQRGAAKLPHGLRGRAARVPGRPRRARWLGALLGLILAACSDAGTREPAIGAGQLRSVATPAAMQGPLPAALPPLRASAPAAARDRCSARRVAAPRIRARLGAGAERGVALFCDGEPLAASVAALGARALVVNPEPCAPGRRRLRAALARRRRTAAPRVRDGGRGRPRLRALRPPRSPRDRPLSRRLLAARRAAAATRASDSRSISAASASPRSRWSRPSSPAPRVSTASARSRT